MKADDIKTKCLPVVEDLDGFSNGLDYIDQNSEDYCAYITSLADIYYWLSVETVWGKMGFQWNRIDDYGHFTKTSVPFTIIPRIPDGHRIKRIYSDFITNINSSVIDIRKSNWENLNTLYLSFAHNSLDRTVTADFTGANLTFVGGQQGYSSKKLTLYIKADFSNITYISYCLYSFGNSVTFIIDDNNKHLNIPYYIKNGASGEAMQSLFHYKGNDAFTPLFIFKEILEGSFGYGGTYGTGIRFKSDNHKYHIINFTTTYNNKLKQAWAIVDDNYGTKEYVTREDLPIIKNNKVFITIDMTKHKTLFPYNANIVISSPYYNLKTNLAQYIVDYIGNKKEIVSIPYYLRGRVFDKEDIKNLNSIIDYELLHKVNFTLENGLLDSCLFDGLFDLTIDLKDFTSFSGFYNSIIFEDYDKSIEKDCVVLGNTQGGYDSNTMYFKSLINFINVSFDTLLYYPTIKIRLNTTSSNYQQIVSCRIPENTIFRIKELIIYDILTIPANSKLETSAVYCRSETSYKDNGIVVAEDNSKPCIKLLKSDVPIHFIYQGNIFNSNRINAIEELDWWDRDYLKQSYINTFYYSSRSVTVDHPFILSNCKITGFSQQIVINNLKFIYCVNYNFSTLVRGQTFINQLIEALEPNDTNKTYTITLRNEDYLLLTQEQIEHITVTCNYVLVNKIV